MASAFGGLVKVDDKTVLKGLCRLELHATNATVRSVLAKLGTVNTTYDQLLKVPLQNEISAALKSPVILLNGNYVRQSKGAVSYHGSSALLGKYIPGGRKGWNEQTGIFHLWVIVK